LGSTCYKVGKVGEKLEYETLSVDAKGTWEKMKAERDLDLVRDGDSFSAFVERFTCTYR